LAFQASFHLSPFRVVYGRDPPSLHPYQPGDACLLTVDMQLHDPNEFLMEIREELKQAQQRYMVFYDRNHRELEFTPSKWAWLHLLHMPMLSLALVGKG
jgi:hypothetical protein